jgi:methylamine--corrinoid protein Co-methyltransferase
VVEFTRQEVEDGLRLAPSEVAVGAGKEVKIVRHRNVEDPAFPTVFCGPYNVNTSEDTLIPMNISFARERMIDILFLPGYLNTLDGILVRPGSGLSARTAMIYGRYARDAISRAGRPDMAIAGFAHMALNEIASTNDEWGLRRTDPRVIIFPDELQVDDCSLNMLSYYTAIGCPIYAVFVPLIGGYAGGPEGTAVVAVAERLASSLIGGEILHMGPNHVIFKSQTNHHSLWMTSITNQAIARNTHLIPTTSMTIAGRPGSVQYPLEFAALVTTAVVSGSNITGPRPAQPLGFNHNSGLMGRLFAEIGHAATKLTREQANVLVKTLHEGYKDKLDYAVAPKGKPFNELYDMQTLKPTPEHQGHYDEAKEKLISLGLPLDA